MHKTVKKYYKSILVNVDNFEAITCLSGNRYIDDTRVKLRLMAVQPIVIVSDNYLTSDSL